VGKGCCVCGVGCRPRDSERGGRPTSPEGDWFAANIQQSHPASALERQLCLWFTCRGTALGIHPVPFLAQKETQDPNKVTLSMDFGYSPGTTCFQS
jgi:hypothetical protein